MPDLIPTPENALHIYLWISMGVGSAWLIGAVLSFIDYLDKAYKEKAAAARFALRWWACAPAIVLWPFGLFFLIGWAVKDMRESIETDRMRRVMAAERLSENPGKVYNQFGDLVDK